MQLYGCTCPLLTTKRRDEDGQDRVGRTVARRPEKTSPYHFYQYWINLDDADVGRCLKFFTDLGQEELDALLAAHEADPGKRGAQRRFATELTRLVHGDAGVCSAERATAIFFGAEISDLDDAQLASIFAHVPSKASGPATAFRAGALDYRRPDRNRGCARTRARPGGSSPRAGPYVNNRRIDGIENPN